MITRPRGLGYHTVSLIKEKIMGSVIVELQREALDKDIRVSDLLRKALVVARKLKLTEFQEWIEKELNGYNDEVPEYRMAKGQIRGWNPYNGWIPLIFEDPEEANALSKRATGQTIAEIENLLENGNQSSLHMPFPQGLQRKLSKGFGYETEISLFVSSSALIKTVDAVRNIILNWSLKLEEEGILGEGLSFTDTEKEVATQSPQNINNFYGTVQNPQIAQGSQKSIQVSSSFQIDVSAIKAFLKNLATELHNIELDSDKKAEIESEIATLNAQVASPNPKKGIVKESLQSIRNVLEGASGSAVGQILIEAGKLIFG